MGTTTLNSRPRLILLQQEPPPAPETSDRFLTYSPGAEAGSPGVKATSGPSLAQLSQEFCTSESLALETWSLDKKGSRRRDMLPA